MSGQSPPCKPFFGVAPPDATCPSGEAGCTSCNFDTGKMFGLICIKGCRADCIVAHEGQHIRDLGYCCLRAPRCIQKYGRRRCIDAYNKWILPDPKNNKSGNNPWTECRAYNTGYRKCVSLYNECTDKLDTENTCCKSLWSEMVLQAGWRDDYCKPEPREQDCPYKVDGSLRIGY